MSKFSRKAQLESLREAVLACKKCPLWRTRKNAVFGEGPIDASIMFIGQAPGKKEDETGKPFVGQAGRFLNSLFEQSSIKQSKCFITSVVKCFPPRNRLPKKEEVEACSYFLEKQIELIKPRLIVALGNLAMRTLTQAKQIKKARKKIFLLGKTPIIVTFHPAAGMRFPKIRRLMQRDFHKIKEMINAK